jgi:hypothetical protein
MVASLDMDSADSRMVRPASRFLLDSSQSMAGAGLGRRWDMALSFAGAQRDYVRRPNRPSGGFPVLREPTETTPRQSRP